MSDDHDFPVGSGHKFIPSFSLIVLRIGGELVRVKISCFTRTQIYSSSTSETHFEDFKRLVEEDSTRVFLCDEDGNVKPVLCISVDGGPDENPRHWKNILQYAQYFIYANLDYLCIATHAPGQSAYNMVERSMCSFSAKLGGVILPAFMYGDHLKGGLVVDDEMEPANIGEP